MKFERVTKYPDAILPQRATIGSAGYDFCAAETIRIYPHTIELIPTGIKCKLCSNSWLMLALRSSTPRKKNLMLANGIGIIDSDYYNNPDNEGHIMFQVYNFSDTLVVVEKGERIGQGVILPYETVYDDVAVGERTGGFGSTSNDLPEQMVIEAVTHGPAPDGTEVYRQISDMVMRSNL